MNQQMIISSKYKNNEIREYSSLRVIATLLVVLGHCYYYQIDTLWGVDYSHLVLERNGIFLLIQQLHAFIKVFHMPLFMALSGALFRITWLKGKYKSLFDVIVDKGKRLMIPFFIVSICYSFPIKLLTGYYSTSDNVIVDFIVGQLFVQGNTHLWYLPALFFIFLIAFILEKYVAKHNIGKLFVILIAYLISSKVSW